MKPNLSDKEFFELYVKNNNWYPLQNHGLVDNEIKLEDSDKDFPNQVTTYLNLFKNIQIKNDSVLDLGCGWGRGAHVIKKYFKESTVTGCDIEPAFIEYANSNYKQCNYIVDNFYNTKIKNDSFDFILLNCSMHFFYDQDSFFKNIEKILKKKGMLLITDIWVHEAFFTFLNKCKEYKLRILNMEDLTNQTIEAMKKDIDTTLPKFKISRKSINAFVEIQKERLLLFENNINRQYKFVIQNDYES